MEKSNIIGYRLLKLYPSIMLKVEDFVSKPGGNDFYDAWPEYWQVVYKEERTVKIYELYEDIKRRVGGNISSSMTTHAMAVSCHKIIEIIADELQDIGQFHVLKDMEFLKGKDKFITYFQNRVL